jgi:WD40 repeat protein
MRLWDVRSGKELHNWSSEGKPSPALRGSTLFSPDGRYLFLHRQEGRPWSVWDIEKDKETDAFAKVTDRQGLDAVMPGGREVVEDDGDTHRILAVESGTVVRSVRLDFGADFSPITNGVNSPDGRRRLTAHEDGVLRLHDLETGKELGRITAQDTAPETLCFSGDGRTAAVASHAGRILAWRLPDSPPGKPGGAP